MGSKAAYQFEIVTEDRVEGVPFVRVGDRVAGKATVTAASDIKLNSLEVQLMWKAHGKGSDNEEIVAKESPRDLKAMRAGQPVEVDFEFVVPEDAPISYDGKIVKVAWGIRTYLDIPWAIDDEDSTPLLVLPKMGDESSSKSLQPFRHKASGSSGGCLIVLGLFMFFFLGIMGLVALEESIIPALFCWLFSLIGAALVFVGIHSMMGASLFKELYLETPEERMRIGQKLPVELCWTGAKDFRIDSLVLKFYLEETAILQRGTNSTTYTEKRFEDEMTVEMGRDFRKGDSDSITHGFKIPADGPPSLEASHNKLQWKVEVSMDVPSWPDPSDSWELPVLSRFHPDAFEES